MWPDIIFATCSRSWVWRREAKGTMSETGWTNPADFQTGRTVQDQVKESLRFKAFLRKLGSPSCPQYDICKTRNSSSLNSFSSYSLSHYTVIHIITEDQPNVEKSSHVTPTGWADLCCIATLANVIKPCEIRLWNHQHYQGYSTFMFIGVKM